MQIVPRSNNPAKKEVSDRIDEITNKLHQKAGLKQQVYRQVCLTFKALRSEVAKLVAELKAKMDEMDKSVQVDLVHISDFEFHIKFSGDLLVFSMHTNVVTFPRKTNIMRTPYVQEKNFRGFFGAIMVYNFMADSFLYNRSKDKGYLIARMLVNAENHFEVQGMGPLDFLFTELAQNVVEPQLLRIFIQTAMIASVDTDLYAPPYQTIQETTVQQLLENQVSSSSQKIGFQLGQNIETSE